MGAILGAIGCSSYLITETIKNMHTDFMISLVSLGTPMWGVEGHLTFLVTVYSISEIGVGTKANK